LCGEVRAADAARTLVDLCQHSCYAGLQPGVAKGIGTGCVQERVSDVATLLLCGIAAGGC